MPNPNRIADLACVPGVCGISAIKQNGTVLKARYTWRLRCGRHAKFGASTRSCAFDLYGVQGVAGSNPVIPMA